MCPNMGSNQSETNSNATVKTAQRVLVSLMQQNLLVFQSHILKIKVNLCVVSKGAMVNTAYRVFKKLYYKN